MIGHPMTRWLASLLLVSLAVWALVLWLVIMWAGQDDSTYENPAPVWPTVMRSGSVVMPEDLDR